MALGPAPPAEVHLERRARARDLDGLADLDAGQGPLQQQVPSLVQAEPAEVDDHDASAMNRRTASAPTKGR